MNLDHPELEPFEPELKRLLNIAFRSGIESLHSVGLRLADIERDDSARRRFIRGCHIGYEKAQQRVGQLVIALEAEIRAADGELRCLRRERAPAAANLLAKVRVLEWRQLVLRRITDGILFSLVGFSPWILRRLILEPRIRRIDPQIMKRTLDKASALNAANRYKFALVSDLTTVVQVGDLVQIDFEVAASRRWRLLELKEGKLNELLTGVLESLPEEEEHKTEGIERLRERLGDRAVKQALRMMRQESRLTEVHRIADTDEGIDPATKRKILITHESVELGDYGKSIRHVVAHSLKRGVSAATVDGCLRLVAVRSDMLGGDASFAVRHVLYHLARPERSCALETGADPKEEVREIQASPPVIDLVWHNMKSQWGTPVFLWPIEPERMSDLTMRRMRVFAQFDISAFLRLAEEAGLRVSWITGKDAEPLKQMSHAIPGSPRAYGVRVVVEDGSTVDYMSGFFARAVSDLTRPRDLLGLMRRQPR